MKFALQLLQIVVSIILIVVILIQARGAGLGGIFGWEASVFRTRRGIERTLFRFTIFLIVVFVVLSIFSVGWDRWFGS